MKAIKTTFLAALLAGTLLSQSSCMGSFALTLKVYEFNNNVTGNKYINNLIFWVIGGPVYGFTTTVDVVILNLIEFWSGSNPLADASPLAPNDDRHVSVERSFDRMVLKQYDGETLLGETVLTYNLLDNSWYLQQGTESIRVFSEQNGQVTFYFGDMAMAMPEAGVSAALQQMPAHAGVWAMR